MRAHYFFVFFVNIFNGIVVRITLNCITIIMCDFGQPYLDSIDSESCFGRPNFADAEKEMRILIFDSEIHVN